MKPANSHEERSVATPLNGAEVAVAGVAYTLHAYYELIKPRIALLIVISTAVGYCYGVGQHFNFGTFAHALLGTLLLAAGSATLNQWYERDLDALMKRTRMRPIPAGKVTPHQALIFGVAVSILGAAELLLFVNPLTAALGAFTSLSYLLAYTPWKRKGPFCTTVGAFPGAMPPLIGFAAASGHLSVQAWVLFAIMFLWQFPHFHAIAWPYREEYERVGIRMLAVVKPNGGGMAFEILASLVLLIPATLAPAALHMAGAVYFVAAIILNAGFFYFGVKMAREHNRKRARNLLLASVIYVPILFAVLVVDNPRLTAIL